MTIAHLVVSLHASRRRNREKRRQQDLAEYKRTGVHPGKRKKRKVTNARG